MLTLWSAWGAFLKKRLKSDFTSESSEQSAIQWCQLLTTVSEWTIFTAKEQKAKWSRDHKKEI